MVAGTYPAALRDVFSNIYIQYMCWLTRTIRCNNIGECFSAEEKEVRAHESINMDASR